jgi:hypothetical protein
MLGRATSRAGAGEAGCSVFGPKKNKSGLSVRAARPFFHHVSLRDFLDSAGTHFVKSLV